MNEQTACTICEHQINRIVAEMYRRLGIYKSVSEYPSGHYDKTLALITELFNHMAGDGNDIGLSWLDEHNKKNWQEDQKKYGIQ